MEDIDQRGQILVLLARDRNARGEFGSAVQLLDEIPDLPECPETLLEKADLLCRIAAQRLVAQDLESAVAISERALNLVRMLEAVGPAWAVPQVLLNVGRTFKEVDLARAVSLWDDAVREALARRGDVDCAKLAAELACLFVEVGELERAEHMLPSLSWTPGKERARRALEEKRPLESSNGSPGKM